MLKITSLTLALLLSRGLGQVPEVQLAIIDGGQLKSFTVACDELQCRPADGSADHAFLTGDHKTVAGIFGHAAELETATGNIFAPVLYESGKWRSESGRRIATRKVLVTGEAGRVGEFAEKLGARIEVPTFAPDYFILTFPRAEDSLARLGELRGWSGVTEAQPLLAKIRSKRFIPNDPRFAYSAGNRYYQWHLRNTGQGGGVIGLDVNVVSVWDQFKGRGIKIAIVDDGLETAHPDLSANVDTALDHNWNAGSPDDPTPKDPGEDHGTSCAGVTAARGNNSTGVSGVAPEATLVGLRLIAGDVSDFDEAEAMNWRNDVIQIKSNSWGPNDTGDQLEDAGPLVKAAFKDAVVTGRGGLGTIFTWAAGNGGSENDNVNYDGYANSIYTIAVGAVTDKGERSSYSEPGAAKVISAPSDGDPPNQGIVTTTLVENGTYTNDFGGTSSATPLISGVIALMLEANPGLGWRDVQEILMLTARQLKPTDQGWRVNGGGLHFHHDFGAGLVDAAAAVAMTKTRSNLPPQLSQTMLKNALALAIPDANAGQAEVLFDLSGNAPLRAEHVTVTVDISHRKRGDLAISLVSPAGTVSRLTELHRDRNADFSNWKLMSVHNWGENSAGVWRLKVRDLSLGTTGVLNLVSLEVFGSDSVPVTEPPVFTNPASWVANVGVATSFRVMAENRPDSFSITGLPTGLTFDDSNHLVSGTPVAEGVSNVVVSATNAVGTTHFNLTINIGPKPLAPPIIGTDLVAMAVKGQSFTYVIPATNSPVSYGATPLPAWLTLNGTTGRLSGIPPEGGLLELSVTATNPDGTATSSLTIDVVDSDLDPLARALDAVGFVFTQSGDAQWFVQEAMVQTGTQALQTGAISNSKKVVLSTNVTGPGVLRFYWKVSSEKGFDELRASIDGELALAISGEVDWEEGGLAIPPGNHLVSWTYRKDGNDSAGTDAGWLDHLTFVPGNPFRDFEEAIDYRSLVWTGRESWTGQTAVTQDGFGAIVSTSLPDNGKLVLSTSVTGPGILTFFWKASTEEDFDYFQFSARGAIVEEISGQRNWAQVTYEVPAGETLLEWSYLKDGTASSGADRVWLDQILWHPAGASDLEFWLAQNLPFGNSLTDDFDDDGRPNLLEYALNSDPAKAGRDHEPVLLAGSDGSSFTYLADLAKTGITYHAAFSTDLSTWSLAPDSPTMLNGTLETREVVIPAAQQKVFLRLEVKVKP